MKAGRPKLPFKVIGIMRDANNVHAGYPPKFDRSQSFKTMEAARKCAKRFVGNGPYDCVACFVFVGTHHVETVLPE